MPAKTLSSRQFNQDSSGAKRAANDGPVFITDRGAPSHVLMSMAEYERLTGEGTNIVSMLAMPATVDIDLDIPKLGTLAKPIGLD